jgi:hypothetical protein
MNMRSSPSPSLSPERLEVGLSELFGAPRNHTTFREQASPSPSRDSRDQASAYTTSEPSVAARQSVNSSSHQNHEQLSVPRTPEPWILYPSVPISPSSLRDPIPPSRNRLGNGLPSPSPRRRSPVATGHHTMVQPVHTNVDAQTDVVSQFLMTDDESRPLEESRGSRSTVASTADADWLSGSDSSDEVLLERPVDRSRLTTQTPTSSRQYDQDTPIWRPGPTPPHSPLLGTRVDQPVRAPEEQRQRFVQNEPNTSRNTLSPSASQLLTQRHRGESESWLAVLRNAVTSRSSNVQSPLPPGSVNRSSESRTVTSAPTAPHRPSLSASVHHMPRPTPRDASHTYNRSTSNAQYTPQTSFVTSLHPPGDGRVPWRRLRPTSSAERNRERRQPMQRQPAVSDARTSLRVDESTEARGLSSSGLRPFWSSNVRPPSRAYQDSIDRARRERRERLISQRARAIWRELEYRVNTESSFGLDDSTPTVPAVPRSLPRPTSTVASSDSLETTMIDTSMDWTSRSSDRDRRARRRVDVDTEPHLMDDISSREERYIQFLREVTRSRESPDNVTGTGVSIPRRWEGTHPQGPNRGSYLLSNIGL